MLHYHKAYMRAGELYRKGLKRKQMPLWVRFFVWLSYNSQISCWPIRIKMFYKTVKFWIRTGIWIGGI